MKFGGNKKNIWIYISSFLLILGSFFLLDNTFWQDLMEQAFKWAMSYDTVINLWNTKTAVGNTVLRESVGIEVWDSVFKKSCFIDDQIKYWVDESGCEEMAGERRLDIVNVSAKAPLIVRITKFLLRMTIVLSITMIIFNAIKYMIEILWWKDRKSAESKKNLIFIASGIVLALMSVSIINLIVSVPKSSLKTSDDLSSYQIGCRVWSEILAGDDLKKRICENSNLGHSEHTINYRFWDSDRIWNRCWFPDDDAFNSDWTIKTWKNPEHGKNNDGDRKSITRENMEQICVSDLWWEVIK